MKCPKCGESVSKTSKFCPKCGSEIIQENLCPKCDAKIEKGAKFCASCGEKIVVETKELNKSTKTVKEDKKQLIDDANIIGTKEKIENSSKSSMLKKIKCFFNKNKKAVLIMAGLVVALIVGLIIFLKLTSLDGTYYGIGKFNSEKVNVRLTINNDAIDITVNGATYGAEHVKHKNNEYTFEYNDVSARFRKVNGMFYYSASSIEIEMSKDKNNIPVTTLSSLDDDEEDYEYDEDEEDEENVKSPSNTGTPIAGGTYVIGEDFPAGKYTFIYKTTMSEDDYWSNDYLWITRKGSEGKNETLGGDKYDERFDSPDYSQAVNGKSYYANLKNGDTIKVDSEYGEWTY